MTTVSMQTTVTWDDVAGEITASCTRRAPEGALLSGPGVVGVLAGPAPVVWVYGTTDVGDLLPVLDQSLEVGDVYVACHQPGVIRKLVERGWHLEQVHEQYAVGTDGDVDLTEASFAIRALGPDDLAGWRRALMAWAGLTPELAAAAYPDNFFEVAGPVEVLGVYGDDGELLGAVGRRDQQRSAMLFGLTVAPAARGRGLACALVRAAVAAAARDGAEFVHAQAGLEGAAVAERCGFRGLGAWQQLTRRAETAGVGSED